MRIRLFGTLIAFVFVAMIAVQTASAVAPPEPPAPPAPMSAEVRLTVWYDLPGPDMYVGGVTEGSTQVTHHFILDTRCWYEVFVNLDAMNEYQEFPVAEYRGGIPGLGSPYTDPVDGFQRIIPFGF